MTPLARDKIISVIEELHTFHLGQHALSDSGTRMMIALQDADDLLSGRVVLTPRMRNGLVTRLLAGAYEKDLTDLGRRTADLMWRVAIALTPEYAALGRPALIKYVEGMQP